MFAAVVSAIFPAIAGALGGGMAFTLFFLCMIGQLVWVLKVMPETRGVPLEEMERNLGIELSRGRRDAGPSPARGRTEPTDVAVAAATSGRCAPRARRRRVPPMTIADRPRVDLREVLRTTCAASPVEAIDVMADGLGTLIGATDVQFLITNVTHRAVVRFAGSDANAAKVKQENGRVPVLPLPGTEYERVLRRQQVVRIPEGAGSASSCRSPRAATRSA